MINHDNLSLLAGALEQSNDGIVITDSDLDRPGPRVVWANEAFSRLTGYSREELEGECLRRLQGEKTDPVLLSALRTALEAGESFHGEGINYRKDGSWYWVEWDISPVRDAEGKIAYFISMQRETTNRKAAELALERAMAQMEATNRNLESFARSLSHDLQDPLNTCKGFLQLLDIKKGHVLGADREYMDLALESVDRMTAKIRGMLAMAHMSRNADDAETREVTPLNAVIDSVLKDLHGMASLAMAKVTVDTLPAVSLPFTATQAVFQNLLNNAIKYRHPDRVPEIRISADRPDGDHVAVTVSDNGRGMTSQDVDSLFNEGRRGASSVGTVGSGIGLPFVKRLIDHYGGRIEAKSQPGDGTTFHLTLPLADAEQGASEPA